MRVEVESQVRIAVPREVVASYSADPALAPDWYVNIKSVEWRSDPSTSVGARIDFVAHFLGRRLAYTYEIVEHEPGQRLVMKTADDPFPMETEYTWMDHPEGGTRMTLANRGVPSGFGRIAAPLMKRAIRRANEKDLQLLKSILEREHGSSARPSG